MEEVVLHELRVQHVLDTVRKFLLQMDVPILVLVPSLERRLHVAPEKEGHGGTPGTRRRP